MTNEKWIVKYKPDTTSEGDSPYQISFFDTKEQAFLFMIKHEEKSPVIFMEVELKLEINV